MAYDTMAMHGVVFCSAAMAIGAVVFFSLAAMGIRGILFCHSSLVIGIIVSPPTTSAIRSIVICRTTPAMRGKHNNQPKGGPPAKMPATDLSRPKKVLAK
jgi:hypothetical protein